MQQTQKLYEADAYLHDFCAEVCACEPAPNGLFNVALTASAFYPEAGGQPADRGALGGTRVVDVHEKEGVVWHTVTTPLRVGELVQGDLDWRRRFDHMQQHTGEHIVSGIVSATFGFDNVGFHIGENEVRVDFQGALTERELADIEAAANWFVWHNEKVTQAFPTKDELEKTVYRSKKELSGAVRIVTVGSADVCACCGTHVRSASEVGMIKIVSGEPYKGGTRVKLVCGLRALAFCQMLQKNVDAISAALSAKPQEAAVAVARLQQEKLAVRAQLAALENEWFAAKAAPFAGASRAVCFVENLSGDSLRRFCLALCGVCEGVCAVFSAKENGFQYVIGSAKEDVRPLGKKLKELFCANGGGQAALVQGSLKGTKETLESFFAAL